MMEIGIFNGFLSCHPKEPPSSATIKENDNLNNNLNFKEEIENDSISSFEIKKSNIGYMLPRKICLDFPSVSFIFWPLVEPNGTHYWLNWYVDIVK